MANEPHLNREQRIEQGPPTQMGFERVVDEAASVRMRKVLAYGEDRYKDPDEKHSMMILYGDIYRKYIRIKNAIVRGERALDDGETLRETLLDLMVYAGMGVQLLDMFNQPKIDQIAILGHGTSMRHLANIFGMELQWFEDHVEARGQVYGESAVNEAHLRYNYQIAGVEFEVLQYTQGRSWHEDDGNEPPTVSHLGIHVDDLDAWMGRLDGLGYRRAQDVRTVSHTNPAIKDNRRYQYVIYDTRAEIGFYLKLIKRLPYDPSVKVDPDEIDKDPFSDDFVER